MSISAFESLPAEIIFDIFKYLSPREIIQSFASVNKRLLRWIMYEYLWHIHIGDETMSLLTFINYCENILTVIGGRLISLRVTLTNIIGGWAIIASSLRCHPSLSLKRLHLIHIKPHEFDKLLRSHLIKQIHTLIVDVTDCSPFKAQSNEGFYLTKVCSQLPCLTVCQLPFDICDEKPDEVDQYSFMSQIYLPKITNTTHLRKLTIGMSTSYFLERLFTCIPLIENLSVGVKDISSKKKSLLSRKPSPVAAHFLPYLSKLSINCEDNHSFHHSMVLFSCVLNQLSHFSLKLEEYAKIADPLIISYATLQQLCLNRLGASTIYDLNLFFCITNDVEQKQIFKTFINHCLVNQQQPKLIVQETNHCEIYDKQHSFIVYTLPYNGKKFSSHLFCRNTQIFSQTAINPLQLFPHVQELHLDGFLYNNCFSDLRNCQNLAVSMVPWARLRKISICGSDCLKSDILMRILQMAHNVRSLEIVDDVGRLPRMILHNRSNLAYRINKQVNDNLRIHSLNILDYTTTLFNAEQFCISLYNQLPQLKSVAFHIWDSYGSDRWKPLCVADGKHKSTIMIVKLLRFIVDHFYELTSLHLYFISKRERNSPCFPHLIRQQLHEQSLSRPFRLRCSDDAIHIWL
ncbi:unnamed protein product [Adineta ricciae]|uniref:F-box domain-containing protein n=1 Tax=Adineta ricciae TaxID=249248 RepID=A0A813RNP3_ADIRI|nr:unnamed protein product [Adineta ricciae]CAF1182162.1 unnamed protein product [Adineta ricciae]